jgi:hypothetical protein
MLWIIGGVLAIGLLQVIAARKAMRRTGKTYSQTIGFEWFKESLFGVPMWLILVAWLVYSAIASVPARR